MRYLPLAATLYLAACTAEIPYTAQRTMAFAEARDVVEELIMSQYSGWRPDKVAVTEKFFALDYGTSTSTIVIPIANVEGSETHRYSGRVYYRRVTRILLKSWTRNFRRWYIVELEGDFTIRDRVILRTRDLDRAEELYDALVSLVEASRHQPADVENGPSAVR